MLPLNMPTDLIFLVSLLTWKVGNRQSKKNSEKTPTPPSALSIVFLFTIVSVLVWSFIGFAFFIFYVNFNENSICFILFACKI